MRIIRRLTPLRSIALGFILLILLGALLLMLPVSTRNGRVASLTDALFTATSACCVTGLVLRDTATYWSRFGQTVILLLIQIGGLGFVTLAATFFMLAKKRMGLRERELLTESMSASRVQGIMDMARFAVLGTFFFEGIGAALLAIRFIPRFGLGEGLYFSVFHSVSAFCNAGFDLMGVIEPYASFMPYMSDWLVNLTLMALIFLGGIGFFVWDDVRKNGLHFKKYTLHAKLALFVSMILTLGGATLLFFYEPSNMPFGTRLLTSLFGSVTARTAGFNTVDTAALSTGGKLTTMLLMFIGGSPASTAGGVKTTTIAVLIMYATAGFRGEKHVNMFGRSVGDDTLKRAVLVVLTNFTVAFAGALLICMTQQIPLSEVMFEVFSAIGTVGMSTGITRELNGLSRYVIIFLMYLGRVGSISFALALLEKRVKPEVMQPVERVTIG